jgi:hypothetical protein
MPDIGNRASIFAFLFRMDPRYQPAGMTKRKVVIPDILYRESILNSLRMNTTLLAAGMIMGLHSAEPTCSMVSEAVLNMLFLSPNSSRLSGESQAHPFQPHVRSPQEAERQALSCALLVGTPGFDRKLLKRLVVRLVRVSLGRMPFHDVV